MYVGSRKRGGGGQRKFLKGRAIIRYDNTIHKCIQVSGVCQYSFSFTLLRAIAVIIVSVMKLSFTLNSIVSLEFVQFRYFPDKIIGQLIQRLFGSQLMFILHQKFEANKRPCKIQCTFYCHRVEKIISPFFFILDTDPQTQNDRNPKNCVIFAH